MPKAQANGIQIHYETKGAGPAVVMLMGLSANLDWWAPEFIEAMTRDFQLLLLDNRGAGRSDAPAEDYTIPLMAEDTVALMKAVGMEKAHIFGLSMGGMIAQEIALRYPGSVERLVLGATHCGPAHSIQASREVTARMLQRNYKNVDEFIAEMLPILVPEDYLAEHPALVAEMKRRWWIAPIRPAAYTRQLQAIMRFDTFDRLERIEAPTLVLTGDRDLLVPSENSSILAKKIPGAKLITLPGGGHSFINQGPERVYGIVRDFLHGKAGI